MIPAHELRLSNFLLQKINHRIGMVACTFRHFELLEKGEGKELYPVVLKPELLLQCGFVENMDYPLQPQAREFRLLLPVSGPGKNEIVAYVKSNKECFARALVNDVAASNNVYHLHQLQNLYFTLTGEELVMNAHLQSGRR